MVGSSWVSCACSYSLGTRCFRCSPTSSHYFTGTKDEWELAKPKYSKIIPDNVTLHYEESAPEALSGDLNGDGEVTDSDAIYLLYHTFFAEDYPLNQPCDFNGDGEVTDSDAVYLLYYTFFPDEYPLNWIKQKRDE